MKPTLICAIVALMVATGCASYNTKRSGRSADTVYTNGKIYTVNEAQPWAEAVAIKDGKFVAVGSNANIEALTGKKTQVIDLAGRFVMPGIVDMHAHPFTGVDLGTGVLNLNNPGDRDAIMADIKAYVASHPDNDVILGGSWNVGGLFENDSPDKKVLDEIAPDVPMFLLSQSGHSAWVNSAALELAGIDENFTNSGTYIFDRYHGGNEPSGTARESAMVLVMSKLHYLAPEVFAEFFVDEIARYSKYGVTAIQTAEGTRSHLQGSALLEKEGRLNVRLFPASDWVTSQLRVLNDDDTRAFIDDWETYETELIKPHYVKIFADGAADSHTLLLREPYTDDPGNLGEMYLPVEDYRKAILYYFSKGMTVHVHAMGDGTIDEIVKIFEEAERTYPDSPASLHLAHAWMATEDQLDRMGALEKVTINFSPMLAIPHPQMNLFITVPLGQDRHQKVFPVRYAIDSGIPVGFGSDFPSSLVPDPSQFWYMEGWVTRQVPDEPELGTVNAANAISVAQAIKGFTLGGAEALGYDYAEVIGSIEVGKSADMVVLDQNLLEIDPGKIHETVVETTVFMGNVVFDRLQAIEELEVVEVDITNDDLQNAIDATELNLLVDDELWGGSCSCFGEARNAGIPAGAKRAPTEVNEAFASLAEQGYAFARAARTVYWKSTDTTYWIQWTLKDDVAVLFAHDPATKQAIEVLRVRDK